MPIAGQIGSYGDFFVRIEVAIKPTERKLFATKGRKALAPLFEDAIRNAECAKEDIKTELYLHR
jgi:hypothetical protein